MTNTTTASTKVTTGKGRLSYAFIWEPRESENGGPSKYSLSFLIPKSDKLTLEKLHLAIEAASEKGKQSKWGGKIPAKLKLPLRDGDEEASDKGEEYRGHMFFNASSTTPPGIVDAQRNAILDKSAVYSGCYARINVDVFPYDSNGNKGIGIGLNHIQFIADGDPLGGAKGKAEDAFDAWEDEGNDLGI